MPELTTLPQLNGNISAIADTSKNMSRQVMSIENSAENIINRNRPTAIRTETRQIISL